MIPLLFLIRRIRMNQHAKRPAMNHQPRDERAELRGCEQVDFEHGDGVWADGFVEECVDAEFGDWFVRFVGSFDAHCGIAYILVGSVPIVPWRR